MNRKKMSTSKEYSQMDARQFKGKLQYIIKINQLGLMVSGLYGPIGIKEMFILYHIQELNKYSSKRGEVAKINFERLINAMPMLKELRCYSKPSISRVINKLEKLELLVVKRKRGCQIRARLTIKATYILNYKPDECVSDRGSTVSGLEKQSVSDMEKQAFSAKEKRGVPAKEKHNSIKNRVNDNLIIVEQSDSDTITEEKIDKYWDEALEYFQSLEPEQRQLYDSRAIGLLDFSCPRPKPGTDEMKRLRVQWYIYDMEGKK